MNVLCVGLAVCDITLRPVPSDIFQKDICFIDKPETLIGGDAANVAVTLSKLGANAALCGYIGNDANGDYVFNQMKKEGIDTTGICRHPDMATVVCYILIEDSGQRHFVVHGQLSDILTERDIPDDLLQNADLVYFGSVLAMKGMDEGGAAALFKKARKLGKMTVADASAGRIERSSSSWLKLLEPVLNETDIFLPSYDEAVIISGEKDLSNIRKTFSKYGIKYLIVKLGEKGCYITDFHTDSIVPAFNSFEPIDTTGAGDSFTGGFIFGTLSGWAPETAALFGNTVAGFNITKPGATAGVPDFETAYNFMTNVVGKAHVNGKECSIL